MPFDIDDQKSSCNNQLILYRDEKERLGQSQERIDKQSKEFRIKNIEGLRGFWLHLTSISAAFVGFIIPILTKGESDIFRMPELTWVGIIVLIINLLFGIIYMNSLLTRENTTLCKQHDYHKQCFNRLWKIWSNCFGKKMNFDEYLREREELSKELDKDENTILKKGKLSEFFDKHFSDLFTFFIIIGFILIIVSLFFKISVSLK